MRFAYKAKKADGTEFKGEAEALSREEVAALLERQGANALEITPYSTKFGSGISLSRKASAQELFSFCNHLAALADSSLPLPEALSALARDSRKPALKKAFSHMADGVSAGHPLEEMLEKEKKVFPPLLAALVKAGQAGGNLSETLRLAATHIWRMEKVRKQLILTVSYPLFVLVLATMVTAGVFCHLVPQMTDIYRDMGIELPGITQLIADISKSLLSHPLLYSGAIFGIPLLLACFAYIFDRFFAKRMSMKFFFLRTIPLLGPVLQNANIARFCRFMATMLASGMPLEQALDLFANLDRRALVHIGGEEMLEAVRKGQSLSAAMQLRASLFPEVLIWIVQSCENSERLPGGMAELSKLYETEVENGTKMLENMLGPICLILVGGMLVVVISALWVPFLCFF